MEIGIIGRSEHTYETMLLLKENGHKISFIVTSKESDEHKYSSNDFKEFAKDNNIPFLHDPKIDSTKIKELLGSNKKPRICVSVNYSGIISKEVIDLFELGILNAHGGDLPRFRGNACQAWAIINKEKKIGLCIHKMIGGELDSGTILDRKYFKLSLDTRIGEVYNWINDMIPKMMLKVINELKKNKKFYLEHQSKSSKLALRTYPRLPEDGRIDWSCNREDIIRLINASSEPFSGAFAYLQNEKIIIWRAKIFDDDENYLAVPGQVLDINLNSKNIIVSAKNGKIEITDVQLNEFRCKPTDLIKSIRKRLK